MNKLLLPTAFAVILSGVSPVVAAPCSVSGVNVTCEGFVDTPFQRNNTDNQRVTVTAGSEVNTTAANADGIRIRSTGNRVTNNGTIAGGIDGIDSDGDGRSISGLYVENNGTITATANADGRAIDARQSNGLYVINNGTILANHKAIRNQDAANASITNTGLIESVTHEGIETGDNARIINNFGGVIRGSDDAIQAGENVDIFNYGLIESVRRGGDEADPQDGIDLDSGRIQNYAAGVIRSDDDAAIDFDVSTRDAVSSVINYGLISGTTGILTDEANTSRQRVVNYGTIEGRDGIAFDLGAGEDEVNLYNGSKLIGAGLFGAGDDLLTLGHAITSLTTGLLDGGEGFDTIRFYDANTKLGLSFTDIASVSILGDVMQLSLESDMASFLLNLTSWENFVFRDGNYSWDQVADLAPIPVPAGVLLLASALAGLGIVRRRRGA